MRKVTFAVLVSGAVFALSPVSALASRHHHHHGGHHSRTHVRHERWGSDGTQPGTTAEEPPAGMVVSFTGGVLTISVNGSNISGRVTSSTELECEAAEPQTMQSHDRGPGGGDNGGQSGDNGDQGDDNGDMNDQGENMCTTAALIPGTRVQEAELQVSSAGAIWEKVELLTP